VSDVQAEAGTANSEATSSDVVDDEFFIQHS